jgi:hypothetical protein
MLQTAFASRITRPRTTCEAGALHDPPNENAANAINRVSIMLISPPREMRLSTSGTPLWSL